MCALLSRSLRFTTRHYFTTLAASLLSTWSLTHTTHNARDLNDLSKSLRSPRAPLSDLSSPLSRASALQFELNVCLPEKPDLVTYSLY